MNPKVDAYLKEGCGRCKYFATPQCKVHSWPNELIKLRQIILDTGLVEELKWSMPCYTYMGKNILILAAFKEFASINFFKGGLMRDELQMLSSPGDNSQAARYMKFTSLAQIEENEPVILSYIQEAIDLEKSGAKIPFKEKETLVYPEELIEAMNKNVQLQSAFEALTPGRKRGYILHFTGAKQSATRMSRIEKCLPNILKGKGWNE